MVRMPLSPRTSMTNRRHHAPSVPSEGYGRSSWETSGPGGSDAWKATSSSYGENTRSSHLSNGYTNSKFTPNKDSPTWRSVQREKRREELFGENRERQGDSAARVAMRTANERIAAAAGDWRLGQPDGDAIKASKVAQPVSGKTSLTSFVEKQSHKYHHQESADTSASVASSKSTISSGRGATGRHPKPQPQPILSCPSSDSTGSSLIYSLGDTVKSSSSTMTPSGNGGSGGNFSATLSAAAAMLDEVREATEEEDQNISGLELTISRSTEEEENHVKEVRDEEESHEDGHGEEGDPAAALVASTLAECRMLLAMSPPPTPVARPGKPMAQKEPEQEEAKSGQKKEQPKQDKSEKTLPPQSTMRAKPPLQEQTQTLPPQKQTELPSLSGTTSTNLSSLAGLLLCPACANEFQDAEHARNRQPLHSFACDHIVCRRCVFKSGSESATATATTLVACPECGEEGAFDTARPVVSRMYLGLVRRMKLELGPPAGEESHGAGAEGVAGKAELAEDGAKKRWEPAVPSQICVPSPTAARGPSVAYDTIKEHGAEDASFGLSGVGNESSTSLPSLAKRHGLQALTVDVASPTDFLSVSQTPSIRDDNKDNKKEGVNADVGVEDERSTSSQGEEVNASLVEPTTPVSRAEFRFLQRKEKLAQSLEKVNRILERSKAGKKEDGKGEWMYQKVVEEESEEDVRECAGSDKNATTPVVKESPGASSVTSRLRTELRIDTGEMTFSPIKSSRARVPVNDSNGEWSRGKDEDAAHTPPPVTSPQEAEGGRSKQKPSVLDIFRIDSPEEGGNDGGTPKLIEFGTNFGSSPMSSNDEGDTLFLLAENRPKQGSLVLAENNAFRNKIKDYSTRGPLSVERRPRLSHGSEQQHCPQFLPSLNYSTMQHESDGFAGLVAMEQSSPMWGGGAASVVSGVSFLSTASGRRTRRSRKSGGGGNAKFFKQLGLSFDEAFRPTGNKSDSGAFGRLDSPSLVDVDDDVNENFPTYEFSVHSCSVSPSSRGGENHISAMDMGAVEDGPLGALVTHKPRGIHKKIFKKFRGIKKGRK